MESICTDLAAEHAALDAVVASLDSDGWATPTAADGWDIRDTIFHLAYFDNAARAAIANPDEFKQMATRVDTTAIDRQAKERSGADLLTAWRSWRRDMLAAMAPLDPKDRVLWFGPPMSARSFATARLMETWSHGRDVADAIGATIEPTDRLKHIAHLGVVTRGWAYMNRGLAVPDAPVRVELRAPSGATWTWGPDDVTDVVSGDAEPFCLVVTQRRHIDDADLDVSGDAARGWMEIAQAFAGPPTTAAARRP